jgi:aminoglycoside phosphotransferase (APT) family kinase protein
MNSSSNMPSPEMLERALQKIGAGLRLKDIIPVEGAYSNHPFIIQAADVNGKDQKFVVKIYAVFGNYDRGEKARREFVALKFAYENGIPVPEPLLLDEKGDFIGSPAIVTEFCDAKHDLSPENQEEWAKTLASTLSDIHALPCCILKDSFILDANREASWFLNSSEPPQFMRDFPRGIEVWKASNDLCTKLESLQTAIVHIDYWPGNILWKNDKIAAVLDWEEAAYGDPIIDVAYARMEMYIMGLSTAAGVFMEEYDKLSGNEARNLIFWELAASARPMFSPQTWNITASPRKEQFEGFIDKTLNNYYKIS